MIQSTHARLAVERRFLCGLFLYPRALDLDLHHFEYPAHRLIFEAIQAAYAEFPWPNTPDGTYDDIALAIVLEFIRARIDESVDGKDHPMRPLVRQAHVARVVSEYERIFHADLFPQLVTPHGLDDLIQQVLECPRCGR